MYDLSGEISGEFIGDIGEWSALVDSLVTGLQYQPNKESQTVKQILADKERKVYLTGNSFWAELKEIT